MAFPLGYDVLITNSGAGFRSFVGGPVMLHSFPKKVAKNLQKAMMWSSVKKTVSGYHVLTLPRDSACQRRGGG